MLRVPLLEVWEGWRSGACYGLQVSDDAQQPYNFFVVQAVVWVCEPCIPHTSVVADLCLIMLSRPTLCATTAAAAGAAAGPQRCQTYCHITIVRTCAGHLWSLTPGRGHFLLSFSTLSNATTLLPVSIAAAKAAAAAGPKRFQTVLPHTLLSTCAGHPCVIAAAEAAAAAGPKPPRKRSGSTRTGSTSRRSNSSRLAIGSASAGAPSTRTRATSGSKRSRRRPPLETGE
eukprot:scaffold125853_cov21-Tisochrysis_lutea.AAC.1